MGITFNTADVDSQLKSLRAQIQAAIRPAVEAGVDAALAIPPPYGGPGEGSTRTIPDIELRSGFHRVAGGGEMDIAVVYDWVMSPFAKHCEDAGGQDCPSFAAGGPYTAKSIPATPGDGTTPCGKTCGCRLVPRDPPWMGAEGPAIDAMAEVIRAFIGSE